MPRRVRQGVVGIPNNGEESEQVGFVEVDSVQPSFRVDGIVGCKLGNESEERERENIGSCGLMMLVSLWLRALTHTSPLLW